MNKYTEAEKELAELLGYTYIKSTNYEHPHEYYAKLGGLDTFVPNYKRDDALAFRLMVEHHIDVCMNINAAVVNATGEVQDEIKAKYSDHTDKATAVRYAIVQAVIRKLKGV